MALHDIVSSPEWVGGWDYPLAVPLADQRQAALDDSGSDGADAASDSDGGLPLWCVQDETGAHWSLPPPEGLKLSSAASVALVGVALHV